MRDLYQLLVELGSTTNMVIIILIWAILYIYIYICIYRYITKCWNICYYICICVNKSDASLSLQATIDEDIVNIFRYLQLKLIINYILCITYYMLYIYIDMYIYTIRNVKEST